MKTLKHTDVMVSNSVLRRYTPPTCTLQIIARSSPLSRWAGRLVLKQLRFELHLDDPQLSEDQKFDVQGDGGQLETLHAELTNYVQHLISQSPEHFSTIFPALSPTYPDTASSSNSQALSAVDALPVPDEDTSTSHVASAPINSEEVNKDLNDPISNQQIHLSPGKGLTHNLFLGPLATEATGPVIELSTLEIFDLVTALDEYAADMVALPASGRRFSAPPAWVSIAALVLVTAGLSTAVVQFLDRQHSEQQVATNAVPQDPGGTPTEPSVPGGPSLPPTPETLPSAALPPLGVPPASSGLQPRTLPRANPVMPGTPGGLQVQKTPGFPSISRPGSGQVFTTTPISPVLPQARIFDSKTQQSQSRSGYNPFKPGISAPGGARSSSFPDGRLPGTASSLPQLSPASPDLATSSPAANTGNSGVSNNAATLPGGGGSTPAIPKEPKSTAFDTIPQVAEAREFFKQRWNPPSSLTQTLEYSLILGVDGKIQRIEPLNQASNKYLDRTGMPTFDEPFVSPNKSGQSVTIRVVLGPDGKVQTFAQ